MIDPLTTQGFYATRLLARRLIRYAILLFLIAAGLWLAGIVMLLAVFDAFVVSWGVR